MIQLIIRNNFQIIKRQAAKELQIFIPKPKPDSSNK